MINLQTCTEMKLKKIMTDNSKKIKKMITINIRIIPSFLIFFQYHYINSTIKLINFKQLRIKLPLFSFVAQICVT